MRLFIGVKLSDETNNAVESAVLKMKSLAESHGLRANWVPRENFHLTVKFLGSADPALVASIKEELSQAAATSTPFELRALGAGSFPSRGAPRVIWVGIERPITALETLAADIERRMVKLGFRQEIRRYSPHLTVARVKAGKSAAQVLAPYLTRDYGRTVVKSVTLFESVTKPTGSEYRVVSEHFFGLS